MDLWVPINKKTVFPSTLLTFVGIEIDSVPMEVRLPLDKIGKIRQALDVTRHKGKVTLRDLQSLIGLLNFACSVVVPGRAFLRRLVDLTLGLRKP